ncbi:uncharacterized protein LOC124287881 [Haliotis rubra]|uniref:uncharacterized protein LOC124287881 n=1 Tax=Haliotis rubra TaxID=36100 RepID=UPI001EE5F57F|nr:uncharacterized protein LOC124287881 [Haliotis rubra]XP_046580327.1 uncharacterized protein LOC124287881 [Haliotis rubra]
MSPRSVRAGVGTCLIHVMLLYNAVMLFPKPITASHIEVSNQTTDVIKGILDGSCFNQTSCQDVVNISCQWQTPDAPVEHAPLCTVWINCSQDCSGNCSHNISCVGNNTRAQHQPEPGDSGILIGALVGGSVMGVAIVCVLISRHVYLAMTRRTKGRMVFSGLNGRRRSTVTLSGKSKISSRRQEVRGSIQGSTKVNSLRDQTVVKEDSQKRHLPKISSDSETEVTSTPDGIVLHIGGSKRAISSTAYEEIADTVMETRNTDIPARNTDIPARNDKTGKKDCLKGTVKDVPAPGVCDGVSNNSIVKRNQISSSGYEDVPDSLGGRCFWPCQATTHTCQGPMEGFG